jgi:uncharacterized protein YaaQ
MKMIIAIIGDHDNESVSQGLIQADLRVTRISSTGGFFRRGSSTLMIGVEDDKVETAIQVIRERTTSSGETGVKRATLFVLNIEHYSQV